MGGQIRTTTANAISLREAEARIAALHGSLEAHPVQLNQFCVRRDRAVTTTERQQLSAVRGHLEARLLGSGDTLAIEALVGQFLIGFEHGRGGSDLNTAALNERYVRALADVPLAAIEAAIDRFEGARTLLPWNRAFRPNPAEFAAEAREGLIGLRTTLVHVRRVLEAEVYDPPTPEQIARVQEAAAAWTTQRAAMEEARLNPIVPPQDFDARMRRIGSLAGLKCSDAAMARHKAAPVSDMERAT